VTHPSDPISDHPVDDLAAYATDALDLAGKRAVEDHLAGCAACRAELAAHREALPTLASAEIPPPAVWQRITAEIGAPGLPDPHSRADAEPARPGPAGSGDQHTDERDDEVAPVASLPEAARARSERRSPPRWGAAVAGLVAAASVGGAVGFALADSRDGGADIGTLAQQALEAPDGVLATLADGEGEPVARVVADDDGAFMLLEDLQDLPEGQAYQLWSVGGPEPVSLGMLGRDGTNTVAFRLPPTITELAISVAPTSGDTIPSGGFEASGGVLQ
jgi:anti-sigma factor RsiW